MRTLPGQPLRRLSSTQYRNTVRDLFGADLAQTLLNGSIFPTTVISSGFINDAEANSVNTEESNAIEDNAERIATLVLAAPDRFVRALLPCPLANSLGDADIDACINKFIGEFGQRVYRRPLTAGETTIVRNLYDRVRVDQPAIEAWSALLQFFVQSPALLYRVERGASQTSSGFTRLTSYEMASRLSYFLLDSLPDEELFAEAAADRLLTVAQVAVQARRLIQTGAFNQVLDGFHRDWLRLYTLEQTGKDQSVFPEYTPAVKASMLEEASQLVRYVLDEADGSVATLLGTKITPVNSVLAAFYGVDASGATDADTWVPVEVPNRRGLLTLGSLMATLSNVDRTNAIHRGAFFQREILCNRLPAFPANLDTQGPLEDTSMLPTARERLSPLLANGTCKACHSQFNPTGLAFEKYDAVGLWREQENGADIDASGTLSLDGTEQMFADPLELAEQISQSEQARDCYTLQWYRAALGRREFAEDACSLAVAQRDTADASGDLREMIVAITQTDGFMYRTPADEVGP